MITTTNGKTPPKYHVDDIDMDAYLDLNKGCTPVKIAQEKKKTPKKNVDLRHKRLDQKEDVRMHEPRSR